MKIEWHDKAVLSMVAQIAVKVAEEAGQDVAKDARRECPVETEAYSDRYGNRPGTLRDSIRVEKSKFSGSVVLVGGRGPWGDAYYAPFVELGTPGTVYKSGKPKGKARVAVQARSFLRKALKRNKSKIRKQFQDALK